MAAGRVVWIGEDGLRHGISTWNRAEHKAVCRALRRRRRVILKATPLSKVR